MIFRIDLKIFVLLILFYLTRQIEIYATIMMFCIVHEFGHLFAGLILKMKPTRCEILPWGLSISFELMPEDFNKKIIKGNMLELKKIFVALAGPLTNFLIILYFIFENANISSKEMIIYSNLLIALFNLLPIYPLDGGRILKSFIHILLGGKSAKVIINKVSNIMLIVITVIGSIGVFYLENIAIFIIIVFLWFLLIKENKKFNLIMKAYNLE